MMAAVSAGPPLFLVVAAVVSTLAVVAVVLLVLRNVRREQRGFDVKAPENTPGDPREPRG